MTSFPFFLQFCIHLELLFSQHTTVLTFFSLQKKFERARMHCTHIIVYILICINDLINSKYYLVYWNSYNNVDSKNDQIFGLKILHFGIKIVRHFLDVLKGLCKRLIKIFWCSCSFKYTTYYWTKIKTICEQWHVQGKFTYSLHT